MALDRGALAQIFADTSGAVTIWDGDPEPFLGPSVLVRLSILAYGEVSGSEVRSVYDLISDTYAPHVVSTRRLSLSVFAQSIALDPPTTYDVLAAANLRIRLPSQLARLAALGMSLSRTEDIVSLNREADRQTLSASSLTVHLRHALSSLSTSPITYSRVPAQPAAIQAENGDYILTVNTTNKVPLVTS